MSNISEVEERLFLLLDTVEKQTVENAELKQTILDLLQTVRQQQAVIEKQNQSVVEQNQTLVTTASQQIKRLEMTQQDFSQLVFNSISTGMKENITNEVNGIASQAIIDAVSETAAGIDTELSKLLIKINTWNSKADNALSKFYKINLKKSEEIAESLEYQQEKLGNEYFKLIAIIGGGIFAIMCVFFFVMYLVLVPTESKSERLRQEQLELSQHIRKLSDNRQKWLQDAQRNGYPRN